MRDLFAIEALVLTWDVAIAALIFLGAFLYGLSAGRKKLLFFTLSSYISLVLVLWFPYLTNIRAGLASISADLISLGLFVGFLFVLYYTFSGSILKVGLPKPRFRKDSFWQTLALSISLAGFLTTVVFFEGASLFIGNLSQLSREVFVNDTARFVWALLPILVIAITRKKD